MTIDDHARGRPVRASLAGAWAELRAIVCEDSTRQLGLSMAVVGLLWGAGLAVLDGGANVGVPTLGLMASHLSHRAWGLLFVLAACLRLHGLLWRAWGARRAGLLLSMFLWLVAATEFHVAGISEFLRGGSFGLLFLFDCWALLRISKVPAWRRTWRAPRPPVPRTPGRGPIRDG